MSEIKKLPVLIDFDGVIRLGTKIAADAGAFLEYLVNENIPSIILSNSTLSDSSEIKSFLARNGIKLNINALTTIDAAIDYLRQENLKASVYCSKKIKGLFKEFIVEDNPDAVLIGDMGNEWSYEILNEIFRKVHNGAKILAMQKNKFWKPDGKTLALDAGAFVAAIEYASTKEATLIGKPSPLYFQSAIKKIGFNKDDKFIMIGDDLETDIKGAQELGGKGILVFTGKTKFPSKDDTSIKPAYTAKNLDEVIKLLRKILTLVEDTTN